MRIGELLALTPSDIDFEKKTISISKTYQQLKGEDIVTTPKTAKSNHIVPIPDFLCEELKTYIACLYDIKKKDRLFPFTKYFLHHEMDRGCKHSGIKRIRLHDLRHSHVALLIEQGFPALLIAERIGHENVETTLNTYECVKLRPTFFKGCDF